MAHNETSGTQAGAKNIDKTSVKSTFTLRMGYVNRSSPGHRAQMGPTMPKFTQIGPIMLPIIHIIGLFGAHLSPFGHWLSPFKLGYN